MADSYKLKAPNGTTVEVATAARRDELVKNRGYVEVTTSAKKTTKKSKSK